MKRIFGLLLLFGIAVACFCGCTHTDKPLEDSSRGTSPKTVASSTENPTEEEKPLVSPDGFFQIHFLDVGYGDAALVICDGKTMLIDGGSSAKTISGFLTEQGISYLDYVVATHAHSDHVGGLTGAFSVADVDVILSTVAESDDKSFQKFADKAKEQGRAITVPKVGDSFSLGEAVVTVLGPVPGKQYEDPNDTSLVLHIVYGETSFLFTGDIEEPAQRDLLESGVIPHATLLKVPHHGKASAATKEFLDAVTPLYGVISIGASKLPADDTLLRLQESGTTVYRTDLNGTVLCSSDGYTLSFETEQTTTEDPNG